MTPRERNLTEIGAIAVKHGFTADDVIGVSRLKALLPVRRECARHFQRKGLGYTAIGRILRRKHSTIFHMLRVPKGIPGASAGLI